MRRMMVFASTAAVLVGISLTAAAQDPRSSIHDALVAKYALTKPTADKTDIVTAGAVLVLEKDDLMMEDVTNPNPYQNTYKNGRITQNALGRFSKWSHSLPGAAKEDTSIRRFVAGEKMWVTKIDVKENGVLFELFTDAYNDVRYGATLLFPFPKGSVPSKDEAEKLVGEVFNVQPADDAKDGQQQAPAGGQQAASNPAPANGPAQGAPAQPAPAQQQTEAPPPAIAPPPPPPADPKTVSIGQTPDQVTASLGQPEKIVKLGTKQIYYYKDMKVIFVNGKVSDVQ